MASVQAFREEYRSRHVGPHYRGYGHLAFTFGLGGAIIVYAALHLDSVRPVEWLTVPLTFLYANLSEYFGHRGPMHHPVRGLGLIFRRHTRQHHRFFTHESMAFDQTGDFKAVLFPPILIVFFIAAFALPVGFLLGWLTTANVAWLFVIVSVGYFLNYEILHFAYHTSKDAWLRRIPGMNRLRRLHRLHHDPQHMQRHNFNITYPIGDWMFGTYKRSSPPDL